METLKQIDRLTDFVATRPDHGDIDILDWEATFHKKIKELRQSCLELELLPDDISGLPSRTSGEKIIEDVESTRKRVGTTRAYSVIFIDIDGLKATNDLQGHATGDFLIATMGRAIINSIRPMDFAFRYGGDEFVIILDSLHPGSALQSTVERVKSRAPKASYGTAIVQDDETLPEAIARADSKMYVEKRQKNGM